MDRKKKKKDPHPVEADSNEELLGEKKQKRKQTRGRGVT